MRRAIAVMTGGTLLGGPVLIGPVLIGAVLIGAVLPIVSSAQVVPARSPAVSTAWRGLPASWPAEVIQSAPTPAPVGSRKAGVPLLGFDTCAMPSIRALKTWRNDYAAIGVYIGGVNNVCYDGLSASWIRSAAALGWSLLPTYVGPQAPCYGPGITVITPAKAIGEGDQAAEDAARDARELQLPARSPVYYDMEAYDAKNPSCTSAVLTFLGAWTRELTAQGYLSGVYSSMDSGIADMQAARSADLAGFTPPQAIWYAQWDDHAVLTDGPRDWPLATRSKQYIGPRNVTVRGVTMNVDSDLVGGPTAR
jgi:hypothetical protein